MTHKEILLMRIHDYFWLKESYISQNHQIYRCGKSESFRLEMLMGNMWNRINEHFIVIHLTKSSPISFQYNNMSSFSMSIMSANGHHKDLYAFNTTNHPLLISHVYTLCWLAKCTRTMDVCSFSEVKGLSKGLNPLINHCSTLQEA